MSRCYVVGVRIAIRPRQAFTRLQVQDSNNRRATYRSSTRSQDKRIHTQGERKMQCLALSLSLEWLLVRLTAQRMSDSCIYIYKATNQEHWFKIGPWCPTFVHRSTCFHSMMSTMYAMGLGSDQVLRGPAVCLPVHRPMASG